MTSKVDDAAIKAMASDPDGPVGKIVEKFTYKVESIAKTLVMIPGSGRMYLPGEYFLQRGPKIYHWVRVTAHQASAPGEPASSDTGFLLGQIHHEITVEETVVGRVISGASYSRYLTTGTRYMEPRDFMRPALAAGTKS